MMGALNTSIITMSHTMPSASVMPKPLTEALARKGIPFTGGVNSPYIWFQCPGGMQSWEFFDYLLENAQVVGTPGAGFGKNGRDYFRLTAFGTHEKTAEAMRRFEELLG